MPPHLAPDIPVKAEHSSMLSEIAQISAAESMATRQTRKFFLRLSDLADLLKRNPLDFNLSHPSQFN